MLSNKRIIIDSVHGNISVEKEYFSLIDTPEFQRLRRLEQSPIRSIFPCAHHDRFIHSIGVFHIGKLIAENLRADAERFNYYEIKEEYAKIEKSYLVACLLHDVGHAPFSHTFERYYGIKENLCKRLIELINNKDFKNDVGTEFEAAGEHEYLSAIIVMTESMSSLIRKLGAEPELVARMIIGRKYKISKHDKRTTNKEIKNCFINLLNGGIIDADRLDYACRDVWASGYAASSIDMERMVTGTHIAKNKATGFWEVCFSVNVLNEIRSVIAIKDFQVQYVINHHVVVYDLDLLENAANEMANYYYQYKKETLPLSNIISEKSIGSEINRLTTNNRQLNLHLLSDDDIIVLVKDCLINNKENKYYTEWKSRNYAMFPIWKTKDEFFYHYDHLLPINKYLSGTRLSSLIKERLLHRLPSLFTNEDDIKIIDCNFKSRLCLDSLNLLVCDEVVKCSDIIPINKVAESFHFFYIYVSNDCITRYKKQLKKQKSLSEHEIKNAIRKKCVSILKPIFEKAYYAKDDTCFSQVIEHHTCDMPATYMTIDYTTFNTISRSNHIPFFGAIADNSIELSSKGEKVKKILDNIIKDKENEQLLGYDMYVNRIRLYFQTSNANYISADKLIDGINHQLKDINNLGENVKIIREDNI